MMRCPRFQSFSVFITAITSQSFLSSAFSFSSSTGKSFRSPVWKSRIGTRRTYVQTVMGLKEIEENVKSVPKHLTSERDVFCNRELNMKQIRAIGFDMDYTLAQYYPTFDLLAFEGAKEKLIKLKSYPEEVLNFSYDATHFTRGLVIDKQRGNIIKMDRHKYVRVAYHGYTELSSDERKRIYNSSFRHVPNFHDSNFVNLDTLFSVVDSVLFSHLVNLKDIIPEELPRSYEQIFHDVRYCVDMCHRDGVIKDRVADDPGRFIMPDMELLLMLRRLKSEGIKTFLLTNSLWDYTSVVMNYLYRVGGGESSSNDAWLDLFDIVIVGACKPAFILDSNLALFRVDTETNKLSNTNDIIPSVGEFLGEGKVFQGGSWRHLHELLELSSGDQLLYVGDHMYSDILRSKRSLGWRTCLIVPELENEIHMHSKHRNLKKFINEIRARQYDLDEWVDQLRYKIIKEKDSNVLEELKSELVMRHREQNKIKKILREEGLKFHHKFHHKWGQLFKSGYQDSHFAQQVSIYACLYTSRASNLLSMSSERSFRPTQDLSVHDQLLASGERQMNLEELRLKIMEDASLESK